MSLKQEAAYELYYPNENRLVAKREGKWQTLTSYRTLTLTIKRESQNMLDKQRRTGNVGWYFFHCDTVKSWNTLLGSLKQPDAQSSMFVLMGIQKGI